MEGASTIIPADEFSYLIMKGKIVASFVSVDLGSSLFTSNEFQQTECITITLDKQEVFLCKIHDPSHQSIDETMLMSSMIMSSDQCIKLNKRSIIFPFSIIFCASEYTIWDSENKIQICKNEKKAVIDRIVIRISSTDSLTMHQIYIQLTDQYNIYLKYPKFPPVSKNSERIELEPRILKEVVQDEFTIQNGGIQLVINNINDSFIYKYLESY